MYEHYPELCVRKVSHTAAQGATYAALVVNYFVFVMLLLCSSPEPKAHDRAYSTSRHPAPSVAGPSTISNDFSSEAVKPIVKASIGHGNDTCVVVFFSSIFWIRTLVARATCSFERQTYLKGKVQIDFFLSLWGYFDFFTEMFIKYPSTFHVNWVPKR